MKELQYEPDSLLELFDEKAARIFEYAAVIQRSQEMKQTGGASSLKTVSNYVICILLYFFSILKMHI